MRRLKSRPRLKSRYPPVVMLLSLIFLLSLAAGHRAATGVSSITDHGPIYHGPAGSGLIALTVNVDWGQEYIPSVLEVCESYQVRMTFFITGRWAAEFPGLVKEIASRGHEIGNHGYAHPHPDHLPVEENVRDIERAEEILRGITGLRPRLYAPPYGERGKAVLDAAKSLDYVTVLWSADSLDWKYRDEGGIIQRVMRKASAGGIVLLHPTAATAAALPSIIEGLRRSGLEPVTVSRLLVTTD